MSSTGFAAVPGIKTDESVQSGVIPAEYFSARALDHLVASGKKWLAHKDIRDAARYIRQKGFNVNMRALLAIWGRETAFGANMGRHEAVRTLASRAFAGSPRRSAFFRRELLHALLILQEGHISPENFKSSYLGATGHPQFMPSSHPKYAVDVDGDGRRDIWTSRTEALASAAKFLKALGWENGKTWGYEVSLPAQFDCRLEGPKHRQTISSWIGLNIKRAAGRASASWRQYGAP